MNLSAIDLNLLLVLHTVLAERSVARAARRLRVTPSAVSNALARLRAALGDPLFARSGRGIVPTPRASELGPALARALSDIDRALAGDTFDPRTCTRTFTLAVADVGQIVRVPRLVSALSEAMPSARLRVVGIDSLVSLGGLSGTEIDVAVGVGDKAPGIHQEKLFEEPMTLVARREHAALRTRASRSVLSGLRHVAVEMAPGKGFRDPFAAVYARAGIARRVTVTVPTFTAAAAVVSSSDLVAVMPTSLLGVLGPRFGIAPLRGTIPKHAITMRMSWHERTHTDAALVAFRELVRRQAEGKNTKSKRSRSPRTRA